MAKNNTMLYLGGAGVLAYLLLKPKTATVVTPGGAITVPGAPAPPASYSDAYYLAYQYPAMVAANPNITNPNYTLTASEANQYMQNYLELQQWLPTVVPHSFPNNQAALQFHWKTYGVAQKYTFLPLIPPKNANWVHPPTTASSSGGGFPWSTVLTTAATVAIAIIGPGPQQIRRLNDAEIDLIINGSAIAKHIVPLYAQADHKLAVAIDNKINELITDYI